MPARMAETVPERWQADDPNPSVAARKSGVANTAQFPLARMPARPATAALRNQSRRSTAQPSRSDGKERRRERHLRIVEQRHHAIDERRRHDHARDRYEHELANGASVAVRTRRPRSRAPASRRQTPTVWKRIVVANAAPATIVQPTRARRPAAQGVKPDERRHERGRPVAIEEDLGAGPLGVLRPDDLVPP